MKPAESRLAPSFLPTTAVLEVTGRCNHDCLFCSCPWYRPDGCYESGPELSTAEWKQVLKKLCGMGVAHFVFTGGEALLREDLRELMEFVADLQSEQFDTQEGELLSELKPPKLYLLSNGRLFTRDWMEWCHGWDVQPSLSLPGLSAFEELTGVDGAGHVLECFSWAKELDVASVANITVTQLNLHELERTLVAALTAGARQVLLNRFLPGGRGLAHTECLELDADGVREMLTVAEDTLSRAGAFGNVGTELPRCLIPNREFKHLEVGSRCSAARVFLWWGPKAASASAIIRKFNWPLCTISSRFGTIRTGRPLSSVSIPHPAVRGAPRGRVATRVAARPCILSRAISPHRIPWPCQFDFSMVWKKSFHTVENRHAAAEFADGLGVGFLAGEARWTKCGRIPLFIWGICVV